MDTKSLIQALQHAVGRRHVLTDAGATERFRTGFRSGSGPALAVVSPGSLKEMWAVLSLVVKADKIVILQAANTGLTGGSTPNGAYDREVVIISTLRLDKIQVIKNGEQVISHAGGTLYALEAALKPFDRQPHSVIGSSCIGASVVGGVCNNSGGALVKRGPAYTEQALFAELAADGELRLVNHLGIDLGDTPEDILGRLDDGKVSEAAIFDDDRRASDSSYDERVRDIDAPTPARYNADPRGLYEASGSAGKVAVFAVRLDTFPTEPESTVYYIGTNDPSALNVFRRRMLTELPELPISGEYLQRDCFDIAQRYGKDTLLAIHWFGTERLPRFFAMKARVDQWSGKFKFLPENMADRVLQALSRVLPEALPRRMLEFRARFEHHLILKVSKDMVAPSEKLLSETMGDGWFRCSPEEEKKAMLHRFAAAGAAVRYAAVHDKEVEDILALDIALRRDDPDWVENLPPEIEEQIIAKLYYGHFFCHVFHQDYIVKAGADVDALKKAMLAALDKRGAEYPAEHNVGHMYEAKPALQKHYRALDPTNSFNPGIGRMPRAKDYGIECGCQEHAAE